MTEITEEFKAYCAAWVDKVVNEDVHEACFPDDIDKGERKVYIMGGARGASLYRK